MRIEHLPDGTTKKITTPIEGVAFYSDWLDLLLSRGMASEVTEQDRMTGEWKKKIRPLDRNQQQPAVINPETEAVGIVCIGCGEPFYDDIQDVTVRTSETKRRSKVIRSSKTAILLSKITIGGMIQVPVEDVISPKEIVVRWRKMPVTKSGIGCKDCRALYEEDVRQTGLVNDARELYGHALARNVAKKSLSSVHPKPVIDRTPCTLHRLPFCAACFKRTPSQTVALPSAMTAYIDVLADATRQEEED